MTNYIDKTISPLDPEFYAGSDLSDIKESQNLNNLTNSDLKSMGYFQPHADSSNPDAYFREKDEFGNPVGESDWYALAKARDKRREMDIKRQMLNVTHEKGKIKKKKRATKHISEWNYTRKFPQFMVISPDGEKFCGPKLDIEKIFPGGTGYYAKSGRTTETIHIRVGKAKGWSIKRLPDA